MDRRPESLTEEQAEYLVAFLQASGDAYVAKITTQKDAVGYFRPCEYGGFLLKSDDLLIKSDGDDQFSAGETKLTIASAAQVEIKPAALTPPSVWGERTHPDNPHVDHD